MIPSGPVAAENRMAPSASAGAAAKSQDSVSRTRLREKSMTPSAEPGPGLPHYTAEINCGAGQSRQKVCLQRRQ